jgi:GMP synthase (glutamine-hydrolysing)
VRPFLLLASRAEDLAADEEYEAFLRCTGLEPAQLHRVRMEAGPLPAIDLDRYAGVVLGGSPFTTSDPPERKSPAQVRVERELGALLDDVVARDLPFLGACYGIGALGVRCGGVVDRTFGEPISCVPVELTADGREDPVFGGLPREFDALVGHKEACRVLPPGATLLATSPGCPVQAFRIGRNVYATQFHPELDVPGIVTRVRVYRNAGYFPPEETDALIDRLSRAVVTEPPRVLAAFAARYA